MTRRCRRTTADSAMDSCLNKAVGLGFLRKPLVLTTILILNFYSASQAQQGGSGNRQFLEFVRNEAISQKAHDRAPESLDRWRQQREKLRQDLITAWGGFPAEPCPLNAQKLGEIPADGYRIEKIIFQTRPDVWMTANAYVPAAPGKHPAVLCVHGHWRGAKQDPVVQSRCIGLVKHGFFVLVVDAFGAGERAVGEALGEYHGEMTGATLFPIGMPLSGLQVYENMRAVDYLQSRPEVDGQRLGITGASGGGNQTMYAGAIDERFSAVVPVCSVGNYLVYLGAACCMCEVVPGALQFTEEWGVLGLTAPRGLMVVNATRDAPQFSVAEAQKSLKLAQTVFVLHGKEDALKHAIFESPHDYNKAMREAMYGWMKWRLANEGSGEPLAEPEIKTLEPEALRCFPGDSRPDDFITIPKFAAREARRILSARESPTDAVKLNQQSVELRRILREKSLGMHLARKPTDMNVTSKIDGSKRSIEFTSEPGITLKATQEPVAGTQLAVLLDLDDGERAASQPIAAELRRAGWSVVTLDLRATAGLAQSGDKIGRAPDHNTAEWALWIGRPLLGQWVIDLSRTLDAIEKSSGSLPKEIAVVGVGPAGLVACCAAALDDRIQRVAAINMLSSYVTDAPYQGQRLAVLVPGVLRDIGDIPHLVGLVAPRRVVLAGGVSGEGKSQSLDELRKVFAPTVRNWDVLQVKENLRIVEPADPAAIVAAISD